MPDSILTLPAYTPYPFDRALAHGGSYSWGFVRKNDDGTLLDAATFAQYTYKAGISDLQGSSLLQEAVIERFNAQSRISFGFAQHQILALPVGSYLFDLVERDPSGNYSVRLRGIWSIVPGASY